MSETQEIITLAQIEAFLEEKGIDAADFSKAVCGSGNIMTIYRRGLAISPVMQRKIVATMQEIENHFDPFVGIIGNGVVIDGKASVWPHNLLAALWREHPIQMQKLGALPILRGYETPTKPQTVSQKAMAAILNPKRPRFGTIYRQDKENEIYPADSADPCPKCGVSGRKGCRHQLPFLGVEAPDNGIYPSKYDR